ncbi:MAG: family 43 glycosylhydrolase [Armatimonadota bacterium]|nr:family 43 glycosylhydrolase [Armatimonadota bacterium]
MKCVKHQLGFTRATATTVRLRQFKISNRRLNNSGEYSGAQAAMKFFQTLQRRFVRFAAFGVLASALAALLLPVQAAEPIRGMIGVGTWATQAEFKDIKVVKGDRTLLASEFSKEPALSLSKGLHGWKTVRGQWQVVDGALRQASGAEDTRALIGDPTWSDYTLTLKARKLGGNEGFLIIFGSPGDETKTWWNLGGWGNTRHAIEAPGTAAEPVAGKIETGRWYDIKIELKGNMIRAFLDNQLVQTATQTPAQRNFGQALIPDMLADPSIVEIDGTFYCYATTDGWGRGLETSGTPVVWKSQDFLNWSFSGSLFPPDFDAKYWAPSAPIYKDGRYYLFPTLNGRITALVSDSLEGPFRALDGKDINKTSGWRQFPITVGHPIDAEIFRDDGSYYMAWSQRYIARLKPDFSSFDGDPTLIRTKRGGYSEGPCLFKRKGIYYYLYTLGGDEAYQYAYMMSRTSPLGPWDAPEQDIIATTDRKEGVFGPGHGCFFAPQGSEQWYFVYLEYGRSSTNRQIYADKMDFNADGTIRPIKLTKAGVGALRPVANQSPNLASGHTAVASSTRADARVPPRQDQTLNRTETFAAQLAVDNSNGSRWMAAAGDNNAWWQLDLGKAQDISRTEAYFVKPAAGHAYKLEYSLDGQTWLPYGGHENVILQSPHSDVKSVRARYLKLTFLSGQPGLWEFRVY